MLDVYITIDTEVWWQDTTFSRVDKDYARWIDGATPEGNFGVDYQMKVFNEYGLKAIYFVEPLFALSDPFLREDQAFLNHLVKKIIASGHDVQLHIHTEWLPYICRESYDLPASIWQMLQQPEQHEHIHQFSLEEQTALLAVAKKRLEQAGAPSISAFRAGNFGASNITLQALAANEIFIDSSYNQDFLRSACHIKSDSILSQPSLINRVLEYPVSCFSVYPSGIRPAQLGACSFGEMKQALMQAWENEWQHFTIVLHSFELLNDQRTQPSPINLKRFHRLCEFLAAHKDKFNTTTFQSVHENALQKAIVPTLFSSWHNTLWRYGEQVVNRFI